MPAARPAPTGLGKEAEPSRKVKAAGRELWRSSAVPFADNYPMPQALTEDGIQEVINAFAAAARRA